MKKFDDVSTQVSVAGFPFGHSSTVEPPVQVHSPPPHVPTPQRWPQVPQLAGSVWLWTQTPPHTLSEGAGQVQTPFRQEDPATHLAPQAPQFSGSERRFAHPFGQPVSPVAHVVDELVQLATTPAATSPATHAHDAHDLAFRTAIGCLPGLTRTFRTV